MTQLQQLRARALSTCRLPAASASIEARFVADMAARAAQPTPLPLTPRQAEWLTALAWRHREQMPKELVPAQNPNELKAPTVPKHKFKCHDCGGFRFFLPPDDPTSSTGCCKDCGSANWNIYNPDGDKIE